MNLDLSNYWDDFSIRVSECIKSINAGTMPELKRLTVHVTNSCNLRCSYCNMDISKTHMNIGLLFKIIREFRDLGGSVIHFTGGEPTVYPYILEACEYSKLMGLTVSMNTNAFIKINTTYIDKLKTSFDSCDPVLFNKMMGIESFDAVVKNMKAYSTEMKDKMLSITAVLNRQTYRDMIKLAEYVSTEFDVYNLYFSNYKGNNPEFAFTDEEIEDMFENYIPKTLEVFKKYGHDYSIKQLSLYSEDDFKNSDVRFPMNKTLPCYIQLSEMSIGVDGSCHNCSHLFRDKVKPNISISVAHNELKTAFSIMKKELKGNYTMLSDKCLSGCNCNLIGFNTVVNEGIEVK